MKNQLLSLSLLVAGACASTDGAQPDDMSAEAHRKAAAEENAKAREHQDRYTPGAERWTTRGILGGDGDGFDDLPDYIYNPSEVHLGHAKLHQAHAQAHRTAAEALEGFEASECAAFKAQTRRLCPLLGAIERLEDTERGVRLLISKGVDARGLFAHMNCHFAFGRVQGREGMTACPLYLEGLELVKTGNRTIEVNVEDEALRAELRKRMTTHVAPKL